MDACIRDNDNFNLVYVGNHYIIPLWDEVKNNIVTKYYFAGSTRLAVRTDGTLRFLLGDHLGSSSVTTNASGAKTASALYREASCKDKAFGETRFTAGTLSTDYKFTGQREESALGIYWFSSRWFDPTLGRFMSPDTIVPTSTQGTQAWDRYAFVNNNPVRYTDPTGHEAHEDPCSYYGYGTEQCPQSGPTLYTSTDLAGGTTYWDSTTTTTTWSVTLTPLQALALTYNLGTGHLPDDPSSSGLSEIIIGKVLSDAFDDTVGIAFSAAVDGFTSNREVLADVMFQHIYGQAAESGNDQLKSVTISITSPLLGRVESAPPGAYLGMSRSAVTVSSSLGASNPVLIPKAAEISLLMLIQEALDYREGR